MPQNHEKWLKGPKASNTEITHCLKGESETLLTWILEDKHRYTHWQHPHTVHHGDICDLHSHHHQFRSICHCSQVNIHIWKKIINDPIVIKHIYQEYSVRPKRTIHYMRRKALESWKQKGIAQNLRLICVCVHIFEVLLIFLGHCFRCIICRMLPNTAGRTMLQIRLYDMVKSEVVWQFVPQTDVKIKQWNNTTPLPLDINSFLEIKWFGCTRVTINIYNYTYFYYSCYVGCVKVVLAFPL